MAVVDFSTLTAAQQKTLLLAANLKPDVGCELLNFDLSLARDLTGYLDATTGDVQWTGGNRVHRSCDLTLATELAWGIALVRIYQTLTDRKSGLSARRNLGVFCLTAPDTPLGESVRLADGSTSPSFAVTGQDRLYLLDREVGASYVVSAGAGVLDQIQAAITAAGLSGVLIDTTASGSTVPTDMAWPLVPGHDDTSSTAVLPADVTATSGSGSTTWLDIVNDLLALISYRGVWCDENGYYRCTPYADPSARAATFTFDADDPKQSTVGISRTISRDLWKAPNRWIFVWSNMPPDGSGNEQTPTTANGGVYVVDNVSDGPSSQTARNGLVWPVQVSFTAASAADLVSQGNARVAADKRVVETFAVSTAPFPIAGHFDVFTYRDSKVDGSPVKVQATHWQIPLNGGDVTWGWEAVS